MFCAECKERFGQSRFCILYLDVSYLSEASCDSILLSFEFFLPMA